MKEFKKISESRDDDKIDYWNWYNEYLNTTKVSKYYKKSQPEKFYEIDDLYKLKILRWKLRNF